MRMVGISAQGKSIRPGQIVRQGGEMLIAHVAAETDLGTHAVVAGRRRVCGIARQLPQAVPYGPLMTILAHDTGRGVRVRGKYGRFPCVIVRSDHVAARAVVGRPNPALQPDCRSTTDCKAGEQDDRAKRDDDFQQDTST